MVQVIGLDLQLTLLVLRERLDHKGHKEIRVLKVLQDFKVLKVLKEVKGLQVLRVVKGLKDLKEAKDLKDQ
jgi:hypothetical protein